MKRIGLATAAFAMMGSAALSQDRMTPEDCVASWGMIEATLPSTLASMPPASATDDGWCQVNDLMFSSSVRMSHSISELSWRLTDVDRLTQEGLLPRGAEIRVTDIRFAPYLDDAVMTYLMHAQQVSNGIDALIEIRWDAVQNAVILDTFDIIFPGDGNTVSLEARIDNVDLTSTTAMQMSLGAAGLTSFDLEIESHGLFESYLLMPIGFALLESYSDTPPEAQVDQLIGTGQGIVTSLPEDFLSERSKEAVNALLADMPNPAGTLRVQWQSDTPLGAAMGTRVSMMGINEANISTVTEGMKMTVDWHPTSGE